MYDPTITMYDEGHPPIVLRKCAENKSLHKGRFLAYYESYGVQMKKVHQLGVKSVLEIGAGEALVANYLRTLGLQYDTMDIITDHNPTIVSSLEDFDETSYKNSYDLVCAFQMLEHLPYERFVDSIKKMSAISRKYIFISLPYSCFMAKFSLNIAIGQLKRKEKCFTFSFPLGEKNRRYREEYVKEFPWAVHYWEIGRKGFPLRRILNDIKSAGLIILEKFHSPNPYHYFILTAKKKMLIKFKNFLDDFNYK